MLKNFQDTNEEAKSSSQEDSSESSDKGMEEDPDFLDLGDSPGAKKKANTAGKADANSNRKGGEKEAEERINVQAESN